MPNEKKRKQDERDDDVELSSPGEVFVVPEEAPPRQPPDKKIHPRRAIPPVPETCD